jgi:hypothetical protein
VKISAEKAAKLPLLDGAVGRLARIRRLFKDVNNTGPDSLLRLATTGRRLELKPETAVSELAGYDAAKGGDGWRPVPDRRQFLEPPLDHGGRRIHEPGRRRPIETFRASPSKFLDENAVYLSAFRFLARKASMRV